MALVFISHCNPYQILFAVNTGVITRYTIFIPSTMDTNFPCHSPLSQPLCCRFFDRCELSFFSSPSDSKAPSLFLIVFPQLRSPSRVIPSYILHSSSALAGVSPASRLRDTSMTHSCYNPVYTNSLLATLNARKKIRNAASANNTPSDVSFSMKDFAKTTSLGSRVRQRTPFKRLIEKPKLLFPSDPPTSR